MKLESEIIGAIVLGSKPWNEDYNVGLVVEQAKKDVASFKIMWMSQKDRPVLDQNNLLSKVIYTWEHPTSIDVLSRIESHG